MFDRQYVEVKVNGETWEEVGNFYDMTEDGHQYILNIGYDNTFDIIFGDGVYGKILTEGDTITVDYLGHNGMDGNITVNEFAGIVQTEKVEDHQGIIYSIDIFLAGLPI